MQKYIFLKLDLQVKRQYFRYEEYINWLQIEEISTYVFMYGVFWPENAFSPFSYTGGLGPTCL